MLLSITLVLLVGCFSAASGFLVEWAQTRRITPPQLFTVLGPLGMLFFAVLGWQEWRGVSWVVVLLGLAGGLTQYLAGHLLKKGLAIGPFSPIWCTYCLAEFMPVVIFASLFCDENITVCQFVSLLATSAAILCGCLAQKQERKENAVSGHAWRYAWYLLLILIAQGALSIILKYTADGAFRQQQRALMVFVYAGMFAGAAVETGYLKQKWSLPVLEFGTLFAAACLGQYGLILLLVTQPATLVFAMSCTTAILFAALGSTLFFHEKRSAAWYVMLVFATLAILFNRM